MHCASSNNQKNNNKFKNKNQPELPENQTVWKSHNQGDKEETFIQTGRRGRDGQPRWRARRQLEDRARWRLAGEAATGGLDNRLRNPEFQRGEIKPQTTD